ncbi:unnamed protein product [Zymoseptoria tritici ST99CH_3D1]|nr:unnamed protein product [Zymoseptoria tritici ST99CH_1E4]SMR63443.1 unnamed protein product [Zymoseptoria tritici ST99CH_3D1]
MDGAHPPCTSNDDFKIKGAASRKDKQTTKPTERINGGDICTICLDPISERAVATPCNHLTFDFLCLVSWLQEQTTCPLCKAEVKEVQYDWRSTTDWKTYHVSKPKAQAGPSTAANLSARRNAARRRDLAPPPLVDTDPTLERRRGVYRNRTPCLHVGGNSISGYVDFTAAEFSTSSILQSRARTFLRRELQVFTFLDHNPRAGSRDYLMEYIVAILRSNEVKGSDGKAEELAGEFLGRENARLLLHELEAWLRSPCLRLREWDGVVQYRDEGQGRSKDHG